MKIQFFVLVLSIHALNLKPKSDAACITGGSTANNITAPPKTNINPLNTTSAYVCDKSVARKGHSYLAPGSKKNSPYVPYTGEIFQNGTSEYFSNCSFTPDKRDETPSQRYVKAKTDCLNGYYRPNTLPDKKIINVFCSPIAVNNHPFYDQVARNTSLAIPPKCDPTYPNSPGSREFFMRMVNTWRNIAKLKPLKWNECLAENSNRGGSGHEGFGSSKCKSGCAGVAEAAFGSACGWNWWRRLTIPMCAFFGDGHRGIFLNPAATKIGFYQTLNIPKTRTKGPNCDFGYVLRVQSC